MHHRFKWAAIPLALFCAAASHAGGFCDDDPTFTVWYGANCPSSRSSMPPLSADGYATFGDPQPNWAEIDLRPFYKQGSYVKPLEFDLSLSQLQLSEPEDVARVEMLRLALMSHELVRKGFNGYRVLAMSAVRRSRTESYSLEFSWREEFEPNATINAGWAPAAGEIDVAVGELALDETEFHVNISPVDGDWSNLSIQIMTLGGANRDVPLAFGNGAGFAMPPIASSGYTQPWSLAAGIIGGDLQTVGMTTYYSFTSPSFAPVVED